MYPPAHWEIIKLDLTENQKYFLDKHKICISDAYLGMLRAYKGNKTIWQSGGGFDVFYSNIREDFDGWMEECKVHCKKQLHDWLNNLIDLSPEDLEQELNCQIDFLTGNKYTNGSLGE